jgi:predicted nucleic acid-binding protein
MTPESALADTSFLLTLLEPRAAGHAVAQGYFTYLVEQNARLYLSTITMAEIQEGLPLEKLPVLPYFRLLPFNLKDAENTGTLRAAWQKLETSKKGKAAPDAGDTLKVIAQALNNNVAALLTADRTLAERLLTPLFAALGEAKPPLRVLHTDLPHEAAFGITGKLF